VNSRLSAVIFGSSVTGVALLALLDAAAKGFAILALACAVAFAMRRSAASARHLVWLAALACALVLPLCSWMLPDWRVLPAWMRWEDIPRRLAVITPPPQPERSFENAVEAPAQAAPDVNEPLVATNLPATPALVVAPRVFRVSATALFTIWAAGAALLLGPLAWSAFALFRISRRADIVRDGRIAGHLVAIANELGLRSRVLVLLGPADAMPMVWGIFRSHLLLPAAAAEWPDARLRGVLVHELAHLRRRDPLALLIAQLALALYWFNPLAWFAVRRLRAEQERACDDFVLRHGIRASEYATDLLAVATRLHAQPFAATALTMAHPARIEGRITSILDAARNRASLTRWLIGATALLAAVISIPLAMLSAAEEKRPPVSAAVPGAVAKATVIDVVTTADSAEISVDEKHGALAFVTGEGAQTRVIVHEFGSVAGPVVFRVSADDRQGKWWDQARILRQGEFDASLPELPDDWLSRGRLVFLASPVKRADGAVVFGEIESASGKTALGVRTANQTDLDHANYRELPRTCPDTEIDLDCRIYALGANAPTKAVILPVMAAQDLTGPPKGALSFPHLTLKPGFRGTYDRMAGRAETVEVTARISGDRVNVDGTAVLRLLEGKFASASEAFRQSEESLRKDSKIIPGNQSRVEFSATLGSNDALVVPIASTGIFPETLVASMTALPRKLSRVRWLPPEARPPIELDGWVLTWPRADHEWFAANFDYKGMSEMISHRLKQRKDTEVDWITSETVGTLKQDEVEALLARFRGRAGVTAERIEPFSAKQNISGWPDDKERTHFKAAGEGASVLPTTSERSISLNLKWDSPVFRHLSASDGYGLNSGTSLCTLLPGPAEGEKIRLLVLRCVDPGARPVPKSAAVGTPSSAPALAGKGAASQPLAGVFLVANDGTTDSTIFPLRISTKPETTVHVERAPLLVATDFERLAVEPVGGGFFTVSVALNKAARKKYSATCERNLGREYVWVIDGVARTRGAVGYATPGGAYGVDIDESVAQAKELQSRFAAALAANSSPRREHPELRAVEWNGKPKFEAAQAAYAVFIDSQLSNGWVHVTAMLPLHEALVSQLGTSPAKAASLHKLRRRLEADEWWKPGEVSTFLDEVAALDSEVLDKATAKASFAHAKYGKPERPKSPGRALTAEIPIHTFTYRQPGKHAVGPDWLLHIRNLGASREPGKLREDAVLASVRWSGAPESIPAWWEHFEANWKPRPTGRFAFAWQEGTRELWLLWQSATEPTMRINRYRLTIAKGVDGDDEGLIEMQTMGHLEASPVAEAASIPADLRAALVRAFEGATAANAADSVSETADARSSTQPENVSVPSR
jgi:beta-lactamase regulating signal transducer with metallopeptidase domain